VSSESIVPAGTFVVRPSELSMAVNEYFELEVVTPDEAPITISCSDPKIVKAYGERGLVALAMGNAKVTIKQGDKSQTVDVKVNSTIEDMRIEPPLIALRAGQPMKVRVMGTVNVDGVKREVDVAPEALVWDKLPKYENAQLDTESLIFRGVKRTDAPQVVRALLGSELAAVGSLTVTGGTMVVDLGSLESADFWEAYPPLPIGRRLSWGGLAYDGKQGGLVLNQLAADSPLYRWREMLPPGALITGIGDIDFSGMTEAEIQAWFAAHPQLVGGDTIRYRLSGSDKIESLVYRLDTTIQEVGYQNATVATRNAGAIQFSLDVYFDKLAQYRFTDSVGAPLSQWQTYGPKVNQRLTTPAVPITADDSYVFYIERMIEGIPPRTFQLNFTLK
jgi:hypothetical protein